MPTTTDAFEAIAKPSKDAFYLTVGLGAMAFEQVRSSQSELWAWFESQIADGKAQFESQSAHFEERVDELLENVQSKLPEQAAELMKQARDAAKSAREQIKDFVNRAAPAQGAAA